MTKDECKQVVLDIIADIAPDEDLSNVKPEVRLRDQMQLGADGMVGHLQDFFDEVQNSSWIGGKSDGGAPFERAAYWIQGALPLAHALGDARGEQFVVRQ